MPTPPLLHSEASGIHPASYIVPAAPATAKDGHLRVDTSVMPWKLQVYSTSDHAWHDVGVTLPIPPSGGGALTQLGTVTLGAPAATLSAAVGGGAGRHLYVVGKVKSVAATRFPELQLQLNASGAAHYWWSRIENAGRTSGNAATSAHIGYCGGTSLNAGAWSSFQIWIYDYHSATATKDIWANLVMLEQANANMYEIESAASWDQTAPVTSVDLTQSGGANFATGSYIEVYTLA